MLVDNIRRTVTDSERDERARGVHRKGLSTTGPFRDHRFIRPLVEKQRRLLGALTAYSGGRLSSRRKRRTPARRRATQSPYLRASRFQLCRKRIAWLLSGTL